MWWDLGSIRDRFWAYSLLYSAQTGSWAHPSSYPVSTGGLKLKLQKPTWYLIFRRTVRVHRGLCLQASKPDNCNCHHVAGERDTQGPIMCAEKACHCNRAQPSVAHGGRAVDFPNKHNFKILFGLFRVTLYISFAKGCPKSLCFVRSEVLTEVEAILKMEAGCSSETLVPDISHYIASHPNRQESIY
jgi:hypothetical protein